MSTELETLQCAIQKLFIDIQTDTTTFSHLMVFDRQYPDIELRICNVPQPYQVYDSYYYKNSRRYNKHYIFLPDYVIENIIKNGFHTGMSVEEYCDYRSKHKAEMSRSEFLCALIVHELSHVFQLYIQDYETDEHHTMEFYDVLETFYSSGWIKTIIVDMEEQL